MIFKGRVVNGGSTCGEAVVVNVPFSFMGDIDPLTGILAKVHPMEGTSLAGKMLVCPTGKGAMISPYVA